MKAILSLLTIMAFAFTFGSAYADEWPTDKSNMFIGTELRDAAYPEQKTEVTMGAAAGGFREEAIDRSAEAWNNLFSHTAAADLPDVYGGFFKHDVAVGTTGAAAGGVREEGRGSEIYDSLLGSRGGPDIAY